MREFNCEKLQSTLWDNKTANDLASIREQKGKTEPKSKNKIKSRW